MSALTQKLAQSQLTRKRLEQIITAAELSTGIKAKEMLTQWSLERSQLTVDFLSNAD